MHCAGCFLPSSNFAFLFLFFIIYSDYTAGGAVPQAEGLLVYLLYEWFFFDKWLFETKERGF